MGRFGNWVLLRDGSKVGLYLALPLLLQKRLFVCLIVYFLLGNLPGGYSALDWGSKTRSWDFSWLCPPCAAAAVCLFVYFLLARWIFCIGLGFKLGSVLWRSNLKTFPGSVPPVAAEASSLIRGRLSPGREGAFDLPGIVAIIPSWFFNLCSHFGCLDTLGRLGKVTIILYLLNCNHQTSKMGIAWDQFYTQFACKKDNVF